MNWYGCFRRTDCFCYKQTNKDGVQKKMQRQPEKKPAHFASFVLLAILLNSTIGITLLVFCVFFDCCKQVYFYTGEK